MSQFNGLNAAEAGTGRALWEYNCGIKPEDKFVRVPLPRSERQDSHFKSLKTLKCYNRLNRWAGDLPLAKLTSSHAQDRDGFNGWFNKRASWTSCHWIFPPTKIQLALCNVKPVQIYSITAIFQGPAFESGWDLTGVILIVQLIALFPPPPPIYTLPSDCPAVSVNPASMCWMPLHLLLLLNVATVNGAYNMRCRVEACFLRNTAVRKLLTIVHVH